MGNKYTSVEAVLADMTKLHQAELNMLQRGFGAEWMRKVANPADKNTFLIKNGKLGYRSRCPAYKGYYLDGIYGATACANINFLLPGIIQSLYCDASPEKCPLFLPSTLSDVKAEASQ